MSIIALAVAKEHVRAVGSAEDATLQLYLDAAELDAAAYLQRSLFADENDRQAARTAAPDALEAAIAAITVGREAAEAVTECATRLELLADLDAQKSAAIATFRREVAGIVLNESIKAAVLLRFGHLYANREAVNVGDIVSELPLGALALLQPYRFALGV